MAGPIIITRAEPGNSETAERLTAKGISVVRAPMLSLRPTGAALPELTNVSGLVFTSANGVRAFADVSDRRDVTAWCVGPATLAAAEHAGFSTCEHADGDANDLADLILSCGQPDTGHLIHVANAAAAGQLVKRLKTGGFTVEFAPLYEAVPASKLPEDANRALVSQAPAIVLIHSAKGADAFAQLTKSHDLSRHHIVAVSARAADPLSDRQMTSVAIAERPNETALLDALFRTYSTL